VGGRESQDRGRVGEPPSGVDMFKDPAFPPGDFTQAQWNSVRDDLYW